MSPHIVHKCLRANETRIALSSLALLSSGCKSYIWNLNFETVILCCNNPEPKNLPWFLISCLRQLQKISRAKRRIGHIKRVRMRFVNMQKAYELRFVIFLRSVSLLGLRFFSGLVNSNLTTNMRIILYTLYNKRNCKGVTICFEKNNHLVSRKIRENSSI